MDIIKKLTVKVKIISIDYEKGKVGLTMKGTKQ